MKLKLNPTQQILSILSAMSIMGILVNYNALSQTITHLLATLGFGSILFFIFSKITRKNKNILNTIISCLIIFLVLHYGTQTKDLIYALLATLITVFLKFFLAPKGLPVFNPVALGLIVTHLVSISFPGLDPAFISWWGASYKYTLEISGNILNTNIALLLVGIWIIFGLKTWRKFPIFFTFLIANGILLFLRESNLESVKFTFLDATIYFFTAIMLIEPKTSPITRNQQIIYAILAALIYNILAYFHIAQFELWAILGANLYFFIGKKLRKPATVTRPIPPAT